MNIDRLTRKIITRLKDTLANTRESIGLATTSREQKNFERESRKIKKAIRQKRQQGR